MNILIISRGIPSEKDPQWGSFEFDQAKALATLGHRVIMASVDARFRKYWRKIGMSTDTIENIHTYNLFICPSAFIAILGKRIKELFTKYLWHKLSRYIQKNEPKIDLIYAHYLPFSYKAVKYLQDLDAPIVAIEHWSELNREPMLPSVEMMAKETYPKVDKLITVSEPLKQRILTKFHVPSVVVHNMIGKEFAYTPIPTKDNVFRIVSVGSLFANKNHQLLIAALATLNLPQDKWQLSIIGEGPERFHLLQQIDQYHLTNNIHLIGKQSKMDIARILNESDTFVLPSISENFSVAVLEALACGLPVIASICGGIRECITDQNGLLFKVNDVDGLSQCLLHMFNHYKEYDRMAIAADCQSRFSSEVIAEQLTHIFEEVIAGTKQ